MQQAPDMSPVGSRRRVCERVMIRRACWVLCCLLVVVVTAAGCGSESVEVKAEPPSPSPTKVSVSDTSKKVVEKLAREASARKRACRDVSRKASQPSADLTRLYFAVGVNHGGTKRLSKTCPALMKRLAQAAGVELAKNDADADAEPDGPAEEYVDETEDEVEGHLPGASEDCEALIFFYSDELNAGRITQQEWDVLTDELYASTYC